MLQVSWCGSRFGICPIMPLCPHGCSSSSPAAQPSAATSSSDACGAGAHVPSRDAIGRGTDTCGPDPTRLHHQKMRHRYLCPIGGMNGLFAKMAMTELRARSGVCTSECPCSGWGGLSQGYSNESPLDAGRCGKYHCFKGGPPTGDEGMETLGCPLHSYPGQLTDNRNCMLCGECVKA